MSAYFTLESKSGSERVTFSELKLRLIRAVNARILNGEFSERGLARILGISQPQIHNVLKGARKLHGDLADRLLAMLGLSLVELFRDEEVQDHQQRANAAVTAAPPAAMQWHFGVDQRTPKKPPVRTTGVRSRGQAVGNR
jgi:plasmid maintenance system antidote protein VapI